MNSNANYIAGVTKLDGTKHETSVPCQGSCEDKLVFNKKVPQYCVATKTSSGGIGQCYLSPYVSTLSLVVNCEYNPKE
ncbi:hypothetical protein Y032_1096g3597 [Ancylostoma ceylanicum]|uniref:Uncharacterized protein n=1 Tax=Ancylostoma ceylanicum TaxID=53326 RepID=A0A016W6J2_9BILA|nr:hypothetical protein Y032_1096g3597 [Ancylostoma ceylanicum]